MKAAADAARGFGFTFVSGLTTGLKPAGGRLGAECADHGQSRRRPAARQGSGRGRAPSRPAPDFVALHHAWDAKLAAARAAARRPAAVFQMPGLGLGFISSCAARVAARRPATVPQMPGLGLRLEAGCAARQGIAAPQSSPLAEHTATLSHSKEHSPRPPEHRPHPPGPAEPNVASVLEVTSQARNMQQPGGDDADLTEPGSSHVYNQAAILGTIQGRVAAAHSA